MRSTYGLTLVAIVAASTAANAQTYSIVDTGQNSFYNNTTSISAPSLGEAFYGQDGQYAGNQPSYTTSDDGLSVLDNVTGLTWTQGADWSGDGVVDSADKFKYVDLQGQADVLNTQNYGGFSDWRVPSIKELYSLVNYNGTDPNPQATNANGLTPFIDNSVFQFAYGDTSAGERIIDSQWGTSTLYVSQVMNGQNAMFGMNFADGRIKGYPGNNVPGNNNPDFYVRFVRGNTDYGTNDFADNGDGTITDDATELMWAEADSGVGMDWEAALAYAENSTLGGYDDWRLPNAKELHSLFDYSRSPDTTQSAAIDPIFDATEITNEAGNADYGHYWSSTTFLRHTGTASSAVYHCFGECLGTLDNVNIIDVHGAGAQRSDPKTGDPNDYPSWGNGPQGDVSRVFNIVRLVRDVSGLAGDFNSDGIVDGMDFLEWQRGESPNPHSATDLADWELSYGAALSLSATNSVPEPSTLWLLGLGSWGFCNRRRPS